MEKEFNVVKAIKAQKEYCDKTGLPHFAPKNGICWKCHQNIYGAIQHERKNWQTGEVVGTYTTGIDVEKAGNELVTGCPHCNRSYCD